ncbi:hypothetical protein CPB84DRAFT_1761737 [Gymnopilus junonius]|uniref:Uncharacterized protein n=1 Tax=Gymnopilus junonius TaxID=109634 RepID=A0A9P5TUX8_GYMJU|nr:hypothetical protein CPB84DRAFT_1761737 [Gymnopilus junonius]
MHFEARNTPLIINAPVLQKFPVSLSCSRMSIIATGWLRATAGSRFTGRFMVNDAQYLIAGSLASSVPTFKSSAATLSYEREGNLTGTKALDGTIGQENILLKFSDGIQIEGKLDSPIYPASSVCGAAFFTQT